MEPDLDRLESLLPRYELSGPRYTSYPTVPVWSEDYGPADFARALSRSDSDTAAGLALYVHIPFCRELCHYCACNRVITRKQELPERYLETLAHEIMEVRRRLPDKARAEQIHLGGGTPTHLHPEQLAGLMDLIDAAFARSEDAELSIEVDPRVTSEAHIELLRARGFRRISLGVQDFDTRVQQAIHRIQPPEQVAELTANARRHGFESVNFDLIYGLPFQTVESFDRSLDHVFEFAPDRVALYSYAHVTWIAKQQRGFERGDLPNAELKLQIMLHAMRRFLSKGYVHIGMDHFAKRDDALAKAAQRGELHRNFMGYTTKVCGDLIGFGPSAISEYGGDYAQSHRSLSDWEQAVANHGLATFRGHSLSEEDHRRGWVISQIMCAGRVSAADYRARFDRSFCDDFAAELEGATAFIEDDLVARDPDGSLSATATGSMLLRNLAMLFDAYLASQRDTGKPIFSKTV